MTWNRPAHLRSVDCRWGTLGERAAFARPNKMFERACLGTTQTLVLSANLALGGSFYKWLQSLSWVWGVTPEYCCLFPFTAIGLLWLSWVYGLIFICACTLFGAYLLISLCQLGFFHLSVKAGFSSCSVRTIELHKKGFPCSNVEEYGRHSFSWLRLITFGMMFEMTCETIVCERCLLVEQLSSNGWWPIYYQQCK